MRMGSPYKYTHMGQDHTRMGKNTRTGRNSIIIISQFLTSRLISPDDGFILRFDSAANPGTSVLIMIPPAYALPPQVRPRKDNVDKR